MKNINFEGRYVSTEEIAKYVHAKIDDAQVNPDMYYQLWIDSEIGFCSPDTNAKISGKNICTYTYEKVLHAIIVIKSGTDVVICRIKDGKVTDERPDEFFLAYKPNKLLVCAHRKGDHDTFVKIKNGDPDAFEKDITVYVMIHSSNGLFRLYFSPDEAKFVEDPVYDDDADRHTIASTMLRFHHIPSNFRTLPVNNESEDDDE